MNVRFSSQNNLGSWIIRLLTWSKWSHVELVLPDGNVFGARMIGGVKARKPLTNYRMMEELTFYTGKDWQAVAMEYDGCGYDFLAIFGWLFRWAFESKDRFTCSELVATICHRLENTFVGSPAKINPRELYLILKNV